MRKQIVALLLVGLFFCPCTEAKSSESIDKDTVRKAITIFRRTPANQQGSMVRPIILQFAQESPDVYMDIPIKGMPWTVGRRKGRRDAELVLFTAYVAGQIQSQLDKRKPKDDPVAGTEQVIATYRQLQQTEPKLKIMEVEKLIDLQKQGKLARDLGTASR